MLRLARLLILPLAGVCFLAAFALADGGATPSADPNALTLSMFYPVLAALCGALAGFIRSKTDSEGFWHQWYGHAVIMIGGSFLGAASDMLARGSITKLALIGAAAGAIGAWASALQNTAKDVKAAAAKTLQVLALGLAFGALASGCAFGKALGACELGKLPTTSEVVIAELATIAADTSKTPQDLLQAAEALAPGQGQCFLTALEAWAQSSGKAGMLGKIRGAKARAQGGACLWPADTYVVPRS